MDPFPGEDSLGVIGKKIRRLVSFRMDISGKPKSLVDIFRGSPHRGVRGRDLTDATKT